MLYSPPTIEIAVDPLRPVSLIDGVVYQVESEAFVTGVKLKLSGVLSATTATPKSESWLVVNVHSHALTTHVV